MTEPVTAPVPLIDRVAERAKGLVPVREIALDAIIPNPEQPRRAFTDQASAEEKKRALDHVTSLAANIQAIGVLQPILVLPMDGSNQYVIVDGECRWRACRLAELPTIPARVLPAEVASRRGQVLLSSLSANVQRSDLSLLDTLHTLVNLLELYDGNQEQLRGYLGWSKSKLSKHLGLRRLTGLALDALNEGLLASPDTASLFSQLSSATQQRFLSAARRTKAPISRVDVNRAIDSAARPAAAKQKDVYSFSPLPPDLAAVLFQALGSELPEPPTARQRLLELLNARRTSTSI